MPGEPPPGAIPAHPALECGSRAGSGFALAATFEYPHYTLVLPDASELTLARLERCFDPPIPNPASGPGRKMNPEAAMLDHDITIDFMDMRDDGRVWARLVDARPGLVPIAGRYVIVGCSDADPAVAKILRVDHEGHIELHVLPGDVESHRDLLTSA